MVSSLDFCWEEIMCPQSGIKQAVCVKQPQIDHTLLRRPGAGGECEPGRHFLQSSGEQNSLFATPYSPSRLHGALRTRVHRIERCRAADIEPVSLLTAEAKIGDRLRNVDLPEQFAFGCVAAYAVLVRI